MTCLHEKFSAEVSVHPLVDEGPIDPKKPADRFMAEVTITCSSCGEPFQFLGPGTGLAMDRPQVNLFGTLLYAPIAPGRREALPDSVRFELPSKEPRS